MMQTNLIGEHFDIFNVSYAPTQMGPTLLLIATGTARAMVADGPGVFTFLIELDAGQLMGDRATRPGELMSFSTAQTLFRVSPIPAPVVSSPEQPSGETP